MESVSTVPMVIGLVGSLETTLPVLHQFASRYDLEFFGESIEHLTTALSNSYQELSKGQNRWGTNWMHAQMDELSVTLQSICPRLDDLEDSIQDMQNPPSTLFRRQRGRFPLIQDVEVAMSSILVAKNLTVMIGSLNARDQDWKRLSETTRPYAQKLRVATYYDPTVSWPQAENVALLSSAMTKGEQIFAWLAGPKDQGTFHEQRRAERITGTCEWLIDTRQFQSWLRHPFDAGDESTLWCQGKAGIGKTMLASKTIDELRGSHVVAYFYMSSGRLHSASDVTASLLRQLCLPRNLVPKRLKHIYDRSNGASSHLVTLDDLIEALEETSRDIHYPIIIVLDALDEVNMHDQGDFAKLISNLKGIPWKFLVTSRSAQDSLSNDCDGCSHLSITDKDVATDIRHYVGGVLKDNGAVDGILSRDPRYRTEVIDTLTTRSNGMFFWAILQTRLILDQIHLSGIRKAVQAIPNDITGVVGNALYMLGLQDIARTQLAKRTLAFLAAARAPLTAEALCHALGIAFVLDSHADPSELIEEEITNPAAVFECCMGLVAIDPVSRIVTLAQYDIEQHLRTRWNDVFPRYAETARLAKCCMAYISLAAFSTGPCCEAEAFSRRLEQYPFLDYASRHWGQHARELLPHQKIDGGIFNNIYRLLSREKRKNLESSLQLCEIDPDLHEKKLMYGTAALDWSADRFQSISSLQVATRYGLTRVVQNMMRTSPGMISKQDSYGMSALHEAARAGWDDLVHILLEAGAKPILTNDQEDSAPSYAVGGDHARITHILHEYPEDANSRYPEGVSSPVRQAAKRGHKSVVSMLRTRSGPLELKEALCDAMEAGESGVVEMLLQGADRVSPNAEKNSVPIMIMAIRGGNRAILRLLLQAGGSPSCKEGSPSDCIPLHQAIRNDRADMVADLLHHGADIEACDSLGRTVLFESLDAPDTGGALLLLTNSIDISSRDPMGNSVLHEAARRGAVEHVSVFVNQGIELNVTNHDGSTPLHLAVQHSHYEIAILLIRASVISDGYDTAGQTPLMYAVSARNIRMVKLLVKSGMPVSSVVASQRTPLILAVAGSHDEMVKILLEHGADPNEHTDLETPLMLAASAGHHQIADLLLEYGASQ